MRQLLFIWISILFLLGSCKQSQQEQQEENIVSTDLPQIKEKGELTVVTLYSSTSYFKYKMQPMGYEYELIKEFAQSEGLKLKMKVAENSTKLLEMLKNGDADVVAYPIMITASLKNQFLFCGRESQECQVLVQRANKGDKQITDVTELIGKEIYVKPNTKYNERLKNLNKELGGGLIIHEVTADTITKEDLIGMVSTGEIPYTVSDENVARLNKTYYWNLNISLEISFLQRSSWAVRKESPQLAAAINNWASDTKRKNIYKALYKRYFELSKRPIQAELPEVKNGHISPYDHLFRQHAQTLDWDWQLLASLCYQESRFNPDVVSWAGAEGLMGIMPNTAKRLNVSPHELKNPDIAIRTGVACLARFRKGFNKITDPTEKTKFTLAAYNAGIGHVFDAQRLAEKYGKDPCVWDNNVAEYIRLKNEPEFYNDSVCKHGYLRGSETYYYVREIMERYHYYLKQTKKH